MANYMASLIEYLSAKGNTMKDFFVFSINSIVRY